MSWLEQVAPTIATALGGPLAGLAVTAIAKVIGVDEKDVQGVIDNGKMSADQIAQLKLAEIEFQKSTQELGLNFEKLATDDRASARSMQVATKSWIPGALALGITIGFFGILLYMMTGHVTPSNELLVMLGSLGTAWTGVVGYYFGSSSSSQHKDELLFNSVPANGK
jgi:hypothetical protein